MGNQLHIIDHLRNYTKMFLPCIDNISDQYMRHSLECMVHILLNYLHLLNIQLYQYSVRSKQRHIQSHQEIKYKDPYIMYKSDQKQLHKSMLRSQKLFTSTACIVIGYYLRCLYKSSIRLDNWLRKSFPLILRNLSTSYTHLMMVHSMSHNS